jgi:5-methyltetrahydropteroyltriglutamate--homocysteine methyltransferase
VGGTHGAPAGAAARGAGSATSSALAAAGGFPVVDAGPFMATGPLTYIGQDAVATDIKRLKDACEGLDVEPYLPAIAPGTIEHWLWRGEHYQSDEEFLFAIADVMHEEYKAITDAGVVLQIDDPDLPDGWQMYPDMTVTEYRKYAELRVEAINHALRGVPEELVRLHVCWGSMHGPHRDDIALEDLIDLIFKVPAECYSIEAANPRHEHEWDVFEDVKLPEGKSLMPGVVGHTSNTIEHPELVAQRLVRYANLVGRENVIAGTDCGLGNRVHAEVVWAKLEDMAKGAELATKELWRR